MINIRITVNVERFTGQTFTIYPMKLCRNTFMLPWPEVHKIKEKCCDTLAEVNPTILSTFMVFGKICQSKITKSQYHPTLGCCKFSWWGGFDLHKSNQVISWRGRWCYIFNMSTVQYISIHVDGSKWFNSDIFEVYIAAQVYMSSYYFFTFISWNQLELSLFTVYCRWKLMWCVTQSVGMLWPSLWRQQWL